MKFLLPIALLVFTWSARGMADHRPIKIMPMGDSITEGSSTIVWGEEQTSGSYRTELVPKITAINPKIIFVGSKEQGPPTLLQRRHEGHSGWRIDQLLSGLTTWIKNSQPDIILLMIGTNDMLQEHYKTGVAKRYLQLIDEIWRLSPKTAILASSILPTNNPKLNLEIRKVNFSIREGILDRKLKGSPVVSVDMYNESGITGDKTDLIDGVHPTALGYKKMATVWFKYLEPYVKRQVF